MLGNGVAADEPAWTASPVGTETISGGSLSGGTALNNVQTLTVTGSSGTYDLSFLQRPNHLLPGLQRRCRPAVQAALNSLSTIGGVGPLPSP